MTRQPLVEIDFAELSDGSLLEVIEDPVDPKKTILALCRRGSIQLVDRFDDGARILIPFAHKDRHTTHVRLAQGAEAYEDVWKLAAFVTNDVGPSRVSPRRARFGGNATGFGRANDEFTKNPPISFKNKQI